MNIRIHKGDIHEVYHLGSLVIQSSKFPCNISNLKVSDSVQLQKKHNNFASTSFFQKKSQVVQKHQVVKLNMICEYPPWKVLVSYHTWMSQEVSKWLATGL